MVHHERRMFAAVLIVCIVGVMVEILNPHSFLSTKRAFIEAAVLAGGIILWIPFSKKAGGKLLMSGSFVLLLAACAYVLYGLSSFCQNTYFERNRSQVTSEVYSCVSILKEQLFR